MAYTQNLQLTGENNNNRDREKGDPNQYGGDKLVEEDDLDAPNSQSD